MDDFEFDDFDLMCIHEHYREYWYEYEYEDMDCGDTENQPTISVIGQDTSIPMQLAPKGSVKLLFINNWTEHHGSH